VGDVVVVTEDAAELFGFVRFTELGVVEVGIVAGCLDEVVGGSHLVVGLGGPRVVGGPPSRATSVAAKPTII